MWHISQESEEHTRAHEDFPEAQDERDPAKGLIILQTVHSIGGGSNEIKRKREARVNHGVLRMMLDNQESLADFKARYNMSIRTLKSVNCPLGGMSEEEQADDFLHKLSPYYAEAVRSLDQDRNLGRRGYPTTVHEAYRRMTEWIFVPQREHSVCDRNKSRT